LRRTSFVVLLVVALAALQIPGVTAAQSFKVIVHPGVEGTDISREILSSIFLKQVARWEGGEPVQPVDQSMRSAVRAAFSEAVFDKPVDGMAMFWADKIRKGIAPPPVKSTDEDVISYVAANAGAIGYVSPGAVVPPNVKALSVIN
jgi:ABC-type phosphate transport system substrate-binding protein